MILLTPTGQAVDTPYRHPEQLTKLAPGPYEETCIEAGGRNCYGKPNYRLAFVHSRFQLAGGFEINCYDSNGNFHHTEECEVLMPRYFVPRSFDGWLVLEVWKSCEWLLAEGFERMEYSPAGKGVRVIEPAWSEGCYEAIERGPQLPWMFPADIDHQTIADAIHVFERSHLISIQRKMRVVRERMEYEKRKAGERAEEMIADFIPPFALAPHVGYTGAKWASYVQES